MTKVTIPRLAIPAFALETGQLLDITIFGQGIKVPPFDMEFWPEIQLLPETVVFDSEWVVDIITGKTDWINSLAEQTVKTMTPAIIEATFNAVKPYLDGLAEDFYRRRG